MSRNAKITRVALLGLVLAVPAQADAPTDCRPVILENPPCLHGAWIGTSNRAERMQAFFKALEGSGIDRSVFPDDYARANGLVIYPDGFYATLSMYTDATIHDTDIHSGDVTIIDVSAWTTPQFGWVWTSGDSLYFCSSEGGGSATVTLSVEGSHGGGSQTFSSPEFRNDYMPTNRYTCAGDSFTLSTDLPEPIGTIQQYYTRVPMDRFGPELNDLAESRFGTPDGDVTSAGSE